MARIPWLPHVAPVFDENPVHGHHPLCRSGLALTLGSALAAWMLVQASGRAQGTFIAATVVTGPFGAITLSAAVIAGDGVSFLTGAGYTAQFYAGVRGTPEDALVPVGAPMVFGSAEGFLHERQGPDRLATVTDVPPGGIATAQLRVWDNELGAKRTWESATIRSRSRTFETPPLSGPRPAPLDATPPAGLRSFQMPALASPPSPAAGRIKGVYSNSGYADPFGGYRPATTQFQAFSGDGRSLILHVKPGSNPEPHPGLVLIQDARDEATAAAGPAIPEASDTLAMSVAGISADGGQWLLNDGSSGEPRVYVVDRGRRQAVSLGFGYNISGDGSRVFGSNLRGDLVSLDWVHGEESVVQGGPGITSFVRKVSHDGSAAVIGEWMWTRSGGLVTNPPSGFVAASVSGDGRTFVGSVSNRPAWWTSSEGVTVFGAADPNVAGRLQDVSHDGGVACGWAVTGYRRLQVWTRGGGAYSLSELLPNGTNSALSGLSGLVAERISNDGRRLFGVGSRGLVPDGRIFAPATEGWLADVVIPGDGPRCRIEGRNPGGIRVDVAAMPGFVYELEERLDGGGWRRLGRGVSVAAGRVTWEQPAVRSLGLFRVAASPTSKAPPAIP